MTTNLIYRKLETRVTFEASGGDAVLTLTSLGTLAGRIGAQWDRGAGAKAEDLIAILRTQWATTPIEGETLDGYLVEGWEFRDGGTPAVKEGGDLPSADTAIANLGDITAGGRYIGSLIVPNSPALDTEYISLPMPFRTAARYIQFAFWNATVDGLHATAGNHELAVYPSALDIQAAA